MANNNLVHHHAVALGDGVLVLLIHNQLGGVPHGRCHLLGVVHWDQQVGVVSVRILVKK